MGFDKSRVYTAVNADELKVGSKVYVSGSLTGLKKKVATGEDIHILGKIWEEDYECRFEVLGISYCYLLAYLVSEPEEKKLKWTDLKIGDVIRGKINKIEYMVIGIYRDKATDEHILIPHSDWLSDELLLEFEKVEE